MMIWIESPRGVPEKKGRDQARETLIGIVSGILCRLMASSPLDPVMPKVEEPASPLEPVSENGEANAVTVAVDGDENGQQPAVGGNSKRFRPAPAKTFQCRGYGDCRMVFSRSEHLARHIRWVLCLLSSKYGR